MVKAYLRYEPTATLGVVSSTAAIAYSADGSQVVTAALESVKIWNVRSGELVKTLSPQGGTGPHPEVTQLAVSPDGRQLAAGHADGTLRLWTIEAAESDAPAAGHSSGVSSLRYSANGSLLASGGQDTSVVVWDVTSTIPLYRLQGHLGQITDLVFLHKDAVLVSCSKDGYARAWRLSSQHCFQTIGGQHGEVTSMDTSQERLVLAYSEPVLEVLSIEAEDAASTSGRDVLHSMGTVQRNVEGRGAQLRFSPDGTLLACLGAGKTIEIFRVRDPAEAKQHMKRRVRRKRKKSETANGPTENGHGSAAANGVEEVLIAADELLLSQVLRSKSKIRAMAFSPKTRRRGRLRIAAALGSNAIEVWELGSEEADTLKLTPIDAAGHRMGIRATAIASDDSLLLTAAETSVKIWNLRSHACLRHIDCNHGLCAVFAAGNRHAVVGTKEGTLDLLDVGSGDRLEAVPAHKGAVWALASLPDGSGLVSGSADHELKFWEWEVREEVQEAGQRRRFLGLKQSRMLKLSDDVLATKVSVDGRLLVVALLDSTVQVFFLDTLKLKGTLYGHKLPVLSLDISSDSTLLVTASADKNIKFWGLDFNDCHKSIFAHSDSVMQVAFVPRTHYVFTVGKDGLLKYWDADRWELLLELKGHHAEVWSLAVSALGDTVVTGSADRSIRIWEKTDEPFFAEEEKENRFESLFETDQPNRHTQAKLEATNKPADAKSIVAGLDSLASRDAMSALADALEDAGREAKRLEEFAESQKGRADPQQAPPNPLLLGLSPAEYVLRSLAGIRGADIEQALLLLPFTYALDLLGYLCFWLERGMKVELSCRVAVLLVRMHHRQLVATPSVRTTLARVQGLLQAALRKKKDTLGFNLAAIRHLQGLMLDSRKQL